MPMILTFDIYSVLLMLGALQGFFLFLALAFHRANRRANRYLAALMLIYSLYLFGSVTFLVRLESLIPLMRTLDVFIEFLFGPLHYLYTRFMVHPEERFRWKHALHFLPIVLVRIYIYSVCFLSDVPFKTFTLNPEPYYSPLLMKSLEILMLLTGCVYMACTLGLLKTYVRQIRDNFSAIEKIKLNWLRTITILSGGVWILALMVNLIPSLRNLFAEGLTPPPITLALTLVIYTMGYMGFRQPEIFDRAKWDYREQTTRSPGRAKYEKTRLREDQAEAFLRRLLAYMEEKRPHLRPALTLRELAEETAIPEHHLSQIINDRLNRNFFNFINGYRIREIKVKMSDPDFSHLSLLGLALESGFSSKTAFNTIFKKHTRMTPSQYRKVLQAGSSPSLLSY